MSPYGFKVFSIFVLAIASCLGQDRGGVDSAVAVWPIQKVLRTANVSGSLEYWGQCDHKSRPDFPRLRMLSDYSGPPLEVLRKMFADDPQMRVTQEPGGMIRMAETDVPADLPDVKISHISFNPIVLRRGTPEPMLGANLMFLRSSQTFTFGRAPSNSPSGPAPANLMFGPPNSIVGLYTKTFGGPNMALSLILSTPEVGALRWESHIRSFPDAGLIPGNAGSLPPVAGELDNVSLSQALDYVLKTFPGFWVYENCHREDGSRTAIFDFY